MVKYVLALGGGGNRGIATLIQMQILDTFLQMNYRKSIQEFFDCFVGCSIGTILMSSIVAGVKIPQFMQEFYQVSSKLKKYNSNAGYKLLCCYKTTVEPEEFDEMINQSCESAYNENGLDMNEDKLTIGMYDKPIAFTINNKDNIFIYSNRDVDDDKIIYMPDMTIQECFKRSASIPLIFGSTKGDYDGGLGANNPSFYGWLYARKLFPGEEIRVVYIGTGKTFREDTLANAGLCGILSPTNNNYLHLFNMSSSTQENQNSFIMQTLAKEYSESIKYYEINFKMEKTIDFTDDRFSTVSLLRQYILNTIFDSEGLYQFSCDLNIEKSINKITKYYKDSISLINSNIGKVLDNVEKDLGQDGLSVEEKIAYNYLIFNLKEIVDLAERHEKNFNYIDFKDLKKWLRQIIPEAKICRKMSFVSVHSKGNLNNFDIEDYQVSDEINIE